MPRLRGNIGEGRQYSQRILSGGLSSVQGNTNWTYWRGLAFIHREAQGKYWGGKACYVLRKLKGHIREVWPVFTENLV